MASFFATADEFAVWLEKRHANQTEFVVGYYKQGSKRPSMTWAESVEQHQYRTRTRPASRRENARSRLNSLFTSPRR